MVRVSAVLILFSIVYAQNYIADNNILAITYKDSSLVKTKVEKGTNRDNKIQIEKEKIDFIDDKQFIIRYIIHSKDNIPYADKYQVSIPLDSTGIDFMKPSISAIENNFYNENKISKTCVINIKKHDFYTIVKSNYTQRELRSTINKQQIRILYNLLLEYKDKVIECVMLNNAQIYDETIVHNLEARQNTFLNTNFLKILASLSSDILSIKILK